uniref:Uncharacterized protein n=1 Tax=Arundo donax TaxID=35708 RepID=A0A0A9CMS7_ARUDO
MLSSYSCDSSVNLGCKIVQHGVDPVDSWLLAVDLSTLGISITLALPLTMSCSGSLTALKLYLRDAFWEMPFRIRDWFKMLLETLI